MRVAVVGHVEWVEFGRVDHVPAAGEIVHATQTWEEPGGGGAVAAVQLAKLAGGCDLFTAVGDDELGARVGRELGALGVTVHAVTREAPTRKAVTFIDPSGERTITTLGDRLQPHTSDDLPWNRLRGIDAVYFTAGESAALRLAREARILVVTSRAFDVLVETPDVCASAVVGSGRDPAERYDATRLREPPGLVVTTIGAVGGWFETSDGVVGRYPASAPSKPVVDTYGGGDSFAAGLAFRLPPGRPPDEGLALAARCGGARVAGPRPHAGPRTRGGAPSSACPRPGLR